MPQIAGTETDGTAAVTARKALSPHPPLDVRADMSTKPQTTRLRLVEMTAAAAQDLVSISPRMARRRACCCPPPRRRSR